MHLRQITVVTTNAIACSSRRSAHAPSPPMYKLPASGAASRPTNASLISVSIYQTPTLPIHANELVNRSSEK
jgi:hypothetical protein